MTMNSDLATKTLRVLACGLLLALAATGTGALENSERDGYLVWLHSLEQTVAARDASGVEERLLLFPFDRPAWGEGDDTTPYRHLAIGKAVTELEELWSDREHDLPPLLALANARNYMNLSEYDSALVWYEITARADTDGRFAREVARESLAAAMVAGDSLGTARRITNTLGVTDIDRRTGEAALAYRWLLVNRDARAIDLMIEKVAAADSLLTPPLRFWHARALAWRERHGESLAQLMTLVAGGNGLSYGLDESERGWVLVAIPDLLYLQGESTQARELYRHLASSSLEKLAMWGRYQVAGIDLANARYRAAVTGFTAVCEGTRFGSWQDMACDLRELAREMERIRAEGEPYGTAAFYRP